MSEREILSPSEVTPFLDQVTRLSSDPVELPHLAPGLVAPTNRWYSGLVFGSNPQPVFPLPMSFGLTANGFGLGLPTVQSAPGLVSAPASLDLQFDAGADDYSVVRYDDVSVTIALLADSSELGQITIARGSPLVSYTATTESQLRVSAPMERDSAGPLIASIGEHDFAVSAPDDSYGGGELTMLADQSITILAMPDGGVLADLAPFMTSPVESVSTSWDSTTTTLEYATRAEAATLIAVLPHQNVDSDCAFGSYATVYGQQRLCAATSISWSVPAIEPSGSLPLSELTAAEVKELQESIGADLVATSELPADTYFGGKALARLANLLDIATQIGDDESATAVAARLADELLQWRIGESCTERCFVYDDQIGGIVGLPASFGSEEFNDHHFHYGYFLYAAAIAVRHDPALVDELRPVMTLLAADIASGAASDDFPARRVFDPYSGHSWASGFSPFIDGNNEESTSEAISAWNGLALWAAAVEDDALEQEARWMLANEVATARAYWLEFDPTTEPYVEYGRMVAGIVWDGKLDYGTWFSADPGAILGIQLLPMQPVADYLGDDPDRVRANLDEASDGALFADYRLMYAALAGDDVLEQARGLPRAQIDDGNSRSYLLAWVLSHR